MSSSTNKREIIPETVKIVDEFTPLLNNNETSNLPIINNPWYKTPSAYWLLPLFSVNAISFGLTVTTKVEFYIQAVCKNYYESKENLSSINIDIINDVDICNIPEIHAITSQLMMILSLCLAIPGIFVLVPLGAFSDRKGRRLALLIAGSGKILDVITIILVGNFMESLGLWFLIIGQLMVGFCGGLSALSAVMYAYGTDCTVPEQRRVIFGLIQGSLFLGIAIGPIIGGKIVEYTNDILSTFYVSLIISILNLLFILFILPESLSKERQLENQKRQLDNVQKNGGSTIFKKIFNIFTPLSIFLSDFSQNNERFQTTENKDRIPAINATRYSLLSATGISLMFAIVLSGLQSIFLLYIRYKFDWSLVDQGYMFGAMSFTRVITLMLLFPIFVKIFKERYNNVNSQNLKKQEDIDGNVVVENDMRVQDEKRMNRELLFDIWVVRFGLVIDMITYALYAIATNGTLFIAGVCLGAVGTVSVSTLKSIQTNLVPPSQTGQLLGALSVLDSITNVVAPIIYNTLYSILVMKNMPHLIWYGISGMFAIGYLLSFGIRPKISKNKTVETGNVEF
ncbi:17476_t:CDS:2 [Cetraspora pellucida]|uniref:17476_t:CDS:1 n=1 Tax=Cetraspora pellucida TaxID=1433469 RepID=A0A9N9C5Y8_9GLOM|nr:17476_t:CDS:2 [Cetraspora pellucida]